MAYTVTKTRFLFHERKQEYDCFIRTLCEIAYSKSPPLEMQNDFIAGVEHVEMQDIQAMQRIRQFSRMKAVTRVYEGTKLTIKNVHKEIEKIAGLAGQFSQLFTSLQQI
jgi:hypothetical protein